MSSLLCAKYPSVRPPLFSAAKVGLVSWVMMLAACLPLGRTPDTYPPSGGIRTRIAVFPPENLSGVPVPLDDIQLELRAALQAKGANLVPNDDVEAFLRRRRLRYTGGLDARAAKAALRELRAEAVLITSVQTFDTTTPKLALILRLVATGATPTILWIDGVAVGGKDAPGLFGVGIVSRAQALRRASLARLTVSLGAYLQGRGPKAWPCPSQSRFAPASVFFAPWFDPQKRKTIALLPFKNWTDRRNSGLAVMLEFIRQLVTAKNIDVVDPGVTRNTLLEHRVIMEDGVGIDVARLIAGASRVDAVVGGTVFDYEDGIGEPKVSFSAIMLEGQKGRVVWRLSSAHSGNDRVFFFNQGRVSTASALTCRMISHFVQSMLHQEPESPADDFTAAIGPVNAVRVSQSRTPPSL